MKKIFAGLIIASSIIFSSIPQVFAGYVNGYYRSNGTYVNGYDRTEADGNPYNNYSYPGNYNPNTGNITGGNPDTYLNNYYNNSSGNSYSPSYNTYDYSPVTTCPLNSYSDGAGSCKCNSGYSAVGSSCVSRDIQCQNQIGYSSSYNSLNNTCECNYGYVIGSSGQCKMASLVCSDEIGLMSEYNSSTKKCECMSGYEFDGSSCKYKSTDYSDYSGYPAYGPQNKTNTYTCPINSHDSTTEGKCDCDTGHQTNSAKNACVPIPIKTNLEICHDSFGLNSEWGGTKNTDGTLNCKCSTGYQFTGNPAKCTIIPKITKQIKNPEPVAEKNFDVQDSDILLLAGSGVLKSSSKLRKCPSTNCSVIRYYAETSNLTISGITMTGDWYRINGTTDAGGSGQEATGWIHKSMFDVVNVNNNAVESVNASGSINTNVKISENKVEEHRESWFTKFINLFK